MARTIDIRIATRLEDKGVVDARAELERLLKAVREAAKAQPQLTAAAERSARAQQQAALAAQRLATEQARTAKETSNAAAAAAQAEIKNLRLAAAQLRAENAAKRFNAAWQGGASTIKRTSDGLAILPRSFAGLTKEVESQITAIAGWGAAFAATGAVVKSFADAFTFKANLDATTQSIELQLRGVRDSGQIFEEARRFGEQYKFTQAEMTAALTSSIPILRTSTASFTDLAGVMARLQVLAPGKTFEEVAFSVKQLQSGDYAPFADALNVSLADAKGLRDQLAAGADIAQVLGEYLDNAGISMETLKTRTEGAMGAMNELKQAQEELALAQAEWASGPGLTILLTNISALRGATRLLSGDWDTAGQSLRANLSWYATYAQVLATTGDHSLALAEADRVLAEGLGYVAKAGGSATGSWDTAADAARNLSGAMAGAASVGINAAGGIAAAASGADAVAQAAANATNALIRMFAVAGTNVPGGSIGGTNTAAGGPRRPNFAGRAAGAATTSARVASIVGTATAPRGGVYIPPARGGGGGGGGGGAAAAVREAERAAEQADDIRYRQEENARELAERQTDAAQDRAERLADIEKDKAERLAEIDTDLAKRQVEIEQDKGARLLDIAQNAAKRLKESRERERADLREIDRRMAEDRAAAARDLQNSSAAALAGVAVSDAFDNLDLAGNADIPELQAREAAQARRREGLQAAAARAAAASDPTVGAAIFAAESRAVDERMRLDEELARRREELAGDPAALAALEGYYAQALEAQQQAIALEVAQAEQAAQLRNEAAEREKEEVIRRAREEREAIEAERKAQTEATIAEAERQKQETIAKAEEQRAEVVAKADEQAAAVEAAYLKQQEAIKAWADEAERDMQRVIDKADEATRALLAVGEGGGGGAAAADASAPTRHSGGPVSAGEAYRVMPNETFVAPESGYVLPFLPMGAGGGGSSSTVNLGGITIVQQPGQDARALADVVMREVTRRMQGRGF